MKTKKRMSKFTLPGGPLAGLVACDQDLLHSLPSQEEWTELGKQLTGYP